MKLLEGVNYAQVDIDFKFVKMVVEEITLNRSTSEKNSKGNTLDSSVYVMVATEDGHFLKVDISPYVVKLYQ